MLIFLSNSSDCEQGDITETHNFTDNAGSDIECYNNVSDWAWSVPWSSATAYGGIPPEDEEDPVNFVR